MAKRTNEINEYNRALEEVARATGALGLGEQGEEDGFPPLPRLNIGGQEFQTKIAILRGQPGSLLSSVFLGEDECEYDEQGRFFFDHDPSYFHNVLDFMRTGDCQIPYERGAFEHFRKQVEYWRLDVLEARCEVHFQKHIKPYLSNDRASGRSSRKGPNGRVIFAKSMQKQKEMHGSAADRVLEGCYASLVEGAAVGHNSTTLTAYRPPETLGQTGLPAWRNPGNWSISNVTYCWDPSLALFFSPVEGVAELLAASEYLVAQFADKGFKAVPKQDASGFSYEVAGTADD